MLADKYRTQTIALILERVDKAHNQGHFYIFVEMLSQSAKEFFEREGFVMEDAGSLIKLQW